MNLKIQNNLCGSFKISFLIPSLLLFKLNLIFYPPFFFFKFEFFTFCLSESSERGTGCQKKIGLKNSLSFQRSGSPLPRHYIYFHLANKQKEKYFQAFKMFFIYMFDVRGEYRFPLPSTTSLTQISFKDSSLSPLIKSPKLLLTRTTL